MKLIAIFIFISLVFFSTTIYGQQANEKQVKVAEKFLDYVQKGQNEKCWKLFDKTNVPDVTKEQFDKAISNLQDYLLVLNSFTLTMNGIKFMNNEEVNFYTFSAVSTKNDTSDEILIDILFFKTSRLIAGIRPKIAPKSTLSE